MVKGHLVQHTHWDREWYFTTEDAVVLSDQVFSEALDELKINHDVNFCLDGQTSIVDEYVSLNPERINDIKKLVAEGRLFVGPWYTQTDALLIDSESILRNLEIGIIDSRVKYGTPMMIGYLPDTFGFNAQMPAILRHAGITSFIGWRGLSFGENVPGVYFDWKSLGSDRVIAACLPRGYSMGMMPVEALNQISDFVKLKLDPETEFVANQTDSDDVLVSAGVDQKSMLLDYDRIVSDYNQASAYGYDISDYPRFIESLESKRLPEFEGELRLPAYARVHRTIGSVRTKTKQAVFALEQMIIRRVEPMMVIARSLGIEVSNGLLIRLWKKLLENQAHDSMGGCVSDNVAEDISHRIKQAGELADGIENIIERRIADALNLSANQVLVFNTDPTPFHGEKIVHIVTSTKNIAFPCSSYAVIEHEQYYPARSGVNRITATGTETIVEAPYYELDVRISVDLPPLGYRVIEFVDSKQPLESYVVSDDAEINNARLSLAFRDGKVRLDTAEGFSIDDFVTLTDCGNDGDTYDFSPLEDENETVLRFSSAYVRESSHRKELVLKGSADLPVCIEDRREQSGVTSAVVYEVVLSIGDDDLIEGKVSVDNQVFSHRVRLCLETLSSNNRSIAQIQNGFLEHLRTEAPADWRNRYVEKPVPIEVFDKSVTVPGEEFSITAFADGIKEYERKESGLFLTLFATTGELGKANLAWRPGRASGDTTNEGHVMMHTPLAQEIGTHSITFGVRISKGEFDGMSIAQAAHARLAPSVSYQRQTLNLFIRRLDNKIWPAQRPLDLPLSFSAFDIPEGLLVSCVMPSLTRKDYALVRFENPSSNDVPIQREGILAQAIQTDALEDELPSTECIPAYGFVSMLVPLR
jgi:alpha-mannosidase